MNEGGERRPWVIRSHVVRRADYSEYRQDLRRDFLYMCGYCTRAEAEAPGIAYEIDHYLPQERFPELRADYTNLIYSCRHCNRYKDDYVPDSDADLNFILRPDRDFPEDHMALDGVRQVPKTQTGDFNITWLCLNRKPLRDLRTKRANYWKAREVVAYGLGQLQHISIDSLPRHHRLTLLKLRTEAERIGADLDEMHRKYIGQIAKSPYLEEDPQQRQDLSERRMKLGEIGVICPAPERSRKRRPDRRQGKQSQG